MGGVLRVVGAGGSKSLEFGVKPIEFVVERSSWLDALNLHWLGVVG